MKKLRIILITIIILTVISTVNVYATEEGTFIINADPSTPIFNFEIGMTWEEFILNDTTGKFEICNGNVYYYQQSLTYEYISSDLLDMNLVPFKQVKFDDEIVDGRLYTVLDLYCEHDFSITPLYSARPCQSVVCKYECKHCTYFYTGIESSTFPHQYGTDLEGYVPPTCKDYGYAYVKCVVCGESKETIVSAPDPNYHLFQFVDCGKPTKCSYCGIEGEISNHTVIEATCTKGSYCDNCGDVLSEPLGHHPNEFGKCQRDNCNYIDAYIAGQAVRDKVDYVGTWLGNGWNNVVEYVTPGEDDKGLFANWGITKDSDNKFFGGLEKVGDVLIIVMISVPIILLVYFVIIAILKIKNQINKNSNEKKGK